ncbi:MAG: recombinase RecA [Candidatus Thermoplasmatota archaeon]|nr:recombinase RecA [Candidatus Thermoplasmatota archaeon]
MVDSRGTPAEKGKTSDSPLDDSMSKSQESLIEELTDIEVVTKDMAEGLVKDGFNSLKDISEADMDDLTEVSGIDEGKAQEIQEELGVPSTDEEEDDELAQWLTGESEKDIDGVLGEEIEKAKEDGPESKSVSPGGQEIDSLKSWLSGEEDTFSDWLGEESFEEEKEELEEELKEREQKIEEKEEELERKTKQLEDLRERFEERVEELEADDFDPEEILEKNNELKTELEEKEEEIDRLKEEKGELKDEIDEIKQGSVAMVKYLKSQKKPGSEPEEEETREVSNKKLKALKRQNEKLKKKLQEIKSKGLKSEAEGSEVGGKIEEKDDQLRELKSEIAKKEEKIQELKEQVKHKEEELNEREEDLRRREEVVRKERKKLESMKKELEGKSEEERKRELEELENEIQKKEEELKAKEKYIDQKEREIKARQEDLLDEEMEERQEEILREIEQEKCKTGTSRLDDLMLGGIPLGSSVSVYGPPHVGKEVLINSFVAEGLEKGVPAIWVITDKTVAEVREEMKFVLPTYEEYEIRGLVKYVDAYSVSMGEVDESEREKDYVTYIEDQSDCKAVTEAVDEFADELNKEHRYYRMAFESVSTIIAYLDTETTFRILQPFSGRRKRDNAVSLYSLEKGMHTDQDISMLGHIMNGKIEFKVEQLKNFLRVEGLGDVQTRDWIEYNHSKSGITMGSFSLDTIR